MAGRLLDALLANESGGRNVANTTQGTSSGQAQGYFQITTGTWNDFGGTKYAPTPLQATYEQQAEIASKIPLKRWDPSTVAKMRATGKQINPDLTLGENLASNGETFASSYKVTPDTSSTQPSVLVGKKGDEHWTKPAITVRHPQNPQTGTGGYVAPGSPSDPGTLGAPTPGPPGTVGDAYAASEISRKNDPFSDLAKTLAGSVGGLGGGTGLAQGAGDAADLAPPTVEFASAQAAPLPAAPPIDTTPLADLFKVAPNIGQAMALNVDAQGNPIRRRLYG